MLHLKLQCRLAGLCQAGFKIIVPNSWFMLTFAAEIPSKCENGNYYSQKFVLSVGLKSNFSRDDVSWSFVGLFAKYLGAWDSTETAKHALTSLSQYFITKNKFTISNFEMKMIKHTQYARNPHH